MRILGLDLGTNSIGWAVVDTEKSRIVDTGVRIFPEGVVAKTIGTGDKEQSKNATRRDKRQMRRQFYRKRLRKIKLLEVLIEEGMCPLSIGELRKWKNWDRIKKSDGKVYPNSPEFINWLRLNPYLLRNKGLKEELSLFELGRVLYHLIQRRGFLSSRKGKEETAIFTKGKPEDNIISINQTREKIENGTLGEYLNSISYKDGVPYAVKTDDESNEVRVRGRYTTREMYVAEFEKIWEMQKEFHGLNGKLVRNKKIREFKGSLNGSRSRKRIEYLKAKFGNENIEIGQKDKKGITKITTYSWVSLKEFLAGKITEVEDNNGVKSLEFKSNESVLFWQRPLRSQKSLLSNCRFEDNLPVITSRGEFLLDKNGEVQKRSKKPCPLSHPEFELFRAFQIINNIKFGKNQELSDEQRLDVLGLINSNDKNFDFIRIPKKLKLTYEKFNFEDKQKIAGNITIKNLKPLFDKKIWDEHYVTIWHCFYFYEDTSMLYKKLKADFNFKGDIETIKKIRLKEGYSNVSLKAIRNILPFLKKGYTFDRAVILGGVKNAFGKRWEYFSEFHGDIESEIISILKEENRDGEAIKKIKDHLATPVFSYGFSNNDPYFSQLYHHSQDVEDKESLLELVPEAENLRNPIVQQGIYEMRRLVNTLIKKYKNGNENPFNFDRINVEMGRDLRNNKSGRQEMNSKIRENEDKNNEARERLAEYGLQASRQNVQKFLMYKEIENKAGNAVCPYTGKTIRISDALGSNNVVQIEHIIPFSVSLDDGFGNKTLCEANFNREKGEKTPYQFHCGNPDPKLWGADSWDEIAERAFHVLPYRKAKKFTSKRPFENQEFIERQLNDSRYIAKKTVELLSNVCNDVRVMPGQLTAELRHLWGLNNILQPIKLLDINKFNIDNEKSLPYYVVVNSKSETLSVHPRFNLRPETDTNQFMASAYVNKNKFDSKFFKIDFDVTGLDDGKYWLKINVADEVKLIPKFTAAPQTNIDEIVFKGKIDKGYFNNDASGRIKTNSEEGFYWAKFEVLDKKFDLPQKGKQPKSMGNKVVLFGNVKNGLFQCYIYQCETNLEDGKYWITLNLNPGNVEFVRSINPKPELEQNEILITATVDEAGSLVADQDIGYQKKVMVPAGKYYAVLQIESVEEQLHRMENLPPAIEKDQSLIEGNIWVDKYTGEIKFDPKKNREDNRHHAIDAITIAFTEQSYLQRLSTYNAKRKEKQRQKLNSSEGFEEPWVNFDETVKNAVCKILVSHKKNNKALDKSKNGLCVRGQLHDATIYGKKGYCNKNEYTARLKIKKLKFKRTKGQASYIDDIIDEGIKTAIYNTIRAKIRNEKDKEILDLILAGVCKMKMNKTRKEKDIERIEINKLRSKINQEVEQILVKENFYLPNIGCRSARLKKDVSNIERTPVPIKKVKVKKTIKNATLLKRLSSLSINKIGHYGGQFVNPGGNHHVLIYKDLEGKMQEDVVQFWTVVERQLQGEEICKLPEDGKSIVAVLEANDNYLLGLSNDEFESNRNNNDFLSKHLYRVQKISSSFYTFRHHLASTLNNKKEEVYIQSFMAWDSYNPINVKISMLGEIEQLQSFPAES
jgi:CRISPR-associated endonuclease Csn1